MESRLKVRVFDNANLFGQHQKRALGFLGTGSNDYRGEIYVVRVKGDNPEDKIMTQGGDGYIRMQLKDEFRAIFGTDSPPFEQVFQHYAAAELAKGNKPLYGKVLRYCCR